MDVVVPILPESIDSAVISALHVQDGESVCKGQILLELETNKVILEITAVANGVVSGLRVSLGDNVKSEQTLMDLSGDDVTLYQERGVVEIDPHFYGLAEEIEESSTKNNSFGLWMVGLFLVIFVISMIVKGLQ